MATFPGGIEINPPNSAIVPGLMNATALYSEIQQIKAQQEEIEGKKKEARLSVAQNLFTNTNLPARYRAQAFNKVILPYVAEMVPDSGLQPIDENAFKDDGFNTVMEEIGKIQSDKTLDDQTKKLLSLKGLAKWQNAAGYQKEAYGTIEKIIAGDDPNQEMTKQKNDAVDSLRKEFTSLPQVKDFQVVSSAYQKIKAGAKQNSAAGDLSLIFSYMKLMDPGSVVREGEFATAQNSAGVPDRIRAQYNKVLKGERLAPAQRRDFIQTSDSIYRSQEKYIGAIEEQFKNLAVNRGLNSGQALLNLRVPPDVVLAENGVNPLPGNVQPVTMQTKQAPKFKILSVEGQ